ncbi:MAG: hypothetical protein H7175_16855 [Burkholderiales bacterium]|nr:hypothetical protein [Anaerolineae bacterium]
MNFLQKLARRIEYGDYEPLAKYGEIFSRKIGKEAFTLKPQLLKSQEDWILRLDLSRRWDSTGNRTLIDCHFGSLAEFSAPFQALLNDVNANETRPAVDLKASVFEKLMLGAASGKVIRSYGRIDRHPQDNTRFYIEMFLSWDDQRYWILLREGRESPEWSKWPAGMADALIGLVPRIEATMSKHNKQAGLSH